MSKFDKFSGTPSHQKGATLIVALIFLVIIVTISLSSIQSTSLEEKMASNNRDRNQALQSAEAGLREAEQYISALVSTTSFGSTAGLLSNTDSEPDYFDTSSWIDTNSIQVASGAVGTLHGLSEYPRFIIKFEVEQVSDTDADLTIGDYNKSGAGDNVTIFKITSRGVGGSSNTQVILQTHYGKRF